LRCASGSDNDNIVFDSFFHDLNVSICDTDLRVVTACHGNRSAEDASLYAIDKRLVGSALINMAVGNAVKLLDDRLK
jgi:hypothetical protein